MGTKKIGKITFRGHLFMRKKHFEKIGFVFSRDDVFVYLWFGYFMICWKEY